MNGAFSESSGQDKDDKNYEPESESSEISSEVSEWTFVCGLSHFYVLETGDYSFRLEFLIK